MRTIVIGATGHIGSYLIPRLAEAGHEVVGITRGRRTSYLQHPAWEQVETVQADRHQEDEAGIFGRRIADLKPDIVIDIVCFNRDSAAHLCEALGKDLQLYVGIGTVWVHGYAVTQPVTEDRPRNPIGDYGINKAAMEAYLLEQYASKKFPAVILHPGHITGPGWNPVNPQGHHNPEVFGALARGEEVCLPNWGIDLVHHVHADDIAQMIMQTIAHRDTAIGESFHAVSPSALTLRGFAEAVCGWFNTQPRLKYLPFEQWKETVSPEDAEDTYGHISRSLCCSIEKACELIDYQPNYTSLQAVKESVDWLLAEGEIEI
jgi:nucleoside-diphosphate-sugar epimerase